MTTHFTSGVTNVTADSTFGKVKAPDPTKYHMYHNDFDTYLASDWTITTTEGGSGNASEALGDGDGGLLVITNDDADDDLWPPAFIDYDDEPSNDTAQPHSDDDADQEN